MEQFLFITLLLNFDGTVVAGNHENGFPPKVLVSEVECKYLKRQNEFIGSPVGLKYLSTAYICERKQMIVASGYNAQTTSIPIPAVTMSPASGSKSAKGDPHMILSTSDDFHLCTRPAATPDMDTSNVLLLMHERTVK